MIGKIKNLAGKKKDYVPNPIPEPVPKSIFRAMSNIPWYEFKGGGGCCGGKSRVVHRGTVNMGTTLIFMGRTADSSRPGGFSYNFQAIGNPNIIRLSRHDLRRLTLTS